MTGDEAVDWYEANAEQYAGTNPDLPIRKWVEWPGVSALLPDLDGQRVLDAGCGDGTFSRRFAERGADVLGVDASRELLAVAERQHGDAIEFRHADLREPLAFLAEGSVDAVVSQLTLDHLEDWDPVFGEFHRVLTPGGCAVVSASHPPTIYAKLAFDEGGQFGLDDPSYFETEPWSAPWGDDDGGQERVRKYRRPLSAQVNAALDAGFVLDGLEEPAPIEEFRRADPARAERWGERPPTFICYRFRR